MKFNSKFLLLSHHKYRFTNPLCLFLQIKHLIVLKFNCSIQSNSSLIINIQITLLYLISFDLFYVPPGLISSFQVRLLSALRKKLLYEKSHTGAPPNTILTWIKNKEKYFKALEDNCSSKKRKLKVNDIEKLDNVAVRWFLSKRSQNILIDGNLIKEKAITYAKELGYNNFRGSAG